MVWVDEGPSSAPFLWYGRNDTPLIIFFVQLYGKLFALFFSSSVL